MSHLFATALLLALGASSAGLLTVFPQPTSPQLFQPHTAPVGRLGSESAEAAMATYLTQVADPTTLTLQTQAHGLPAALAADICVSLPDWQRPSEVAQLKQLEAMPNYGAALQSEPLAALAKAWWSHDLFSFTTYGLSARTDPLFLSGVWTAIDQTWDCYSGDQGEQINQGDLAELWLLHHRLVGLEWQGDRYLITVEPSDRGLQLVQFNRRESQDGLPLSVVTTTGQLLTVMSGDW
jgi:hypothetical protein